MLMIELIIVILFRFWHRLISMEMSLFAVTSLGTVSLALPEKVEEPIKV